ncbi:glutathione peroxidase [Methylobacterium sp. Leaf102]|jgi:hypothetical protein|uniref:DUF3297 family protein n=1 Tax=unclassified Methylobacterium TaxID=2615210 RepID=UPI0006F4B3FD|nr:MULTISPECIES: DUF3297 family protein [unclassified Methylobacterium]USU31790.1 DUF3297 family protein [Methylobacterium sp. OTU13CASTA1]KQO70464.1 glutathione peroxidase [Methylobacterium sp. Leaf87]KQP32471.1 glutathione peroxidase [Methylobacterium sp. Leaf102]KQP33001.1 glutathione peroxidase [Methylobacterium sp. Leaf100]KQP68706.1 glutathione peroxidase [Methylobacterium sp. Leaf112]
MSDTPPDRLAVNPNSPFYDEKILERGIGIRFKGVEKTNVEEYCVSEGWVRLSAGKTLDRAGNPMTVKLKGAVEPYFRDDAVVEG